MIPARNNNVIPRNEKKPKPVEIQHILNDKKPKAFLGSAPSFVLQENMYFYLFFTR